MISFSWIRYRIIKGVVFRVMMVFFLLYLCLATAVAYADDADVKEVLARLEVKMSGIKTLQANFIQEKSLAMFERDIILKGALFIRKPELLAWHVYEPVRHSTIINAQTIQQWDEDTGQTQQISLLNNPVFAAAIAQMKVWFLGTYTGLMSDYEITIRSLEPLELEFVPSDTALTHSIISRITVFFRQDQRYIQHILIEENNGDSTRFTFVDTRLNSLIDNAAWKVGSRVQ